MSRNLLNVIVLNEILVLGEKSDSLEHKEVNLQPLGVEKISVQRFISA